MAGILAGFSAFSGGGAVVTIVIWFGVMLLIGLTLSMFIVLLLVRLQTKGIIELNMVNKKIRMFSGREKITKSGIKNFFSRKVGRFVPIVQEKYRWTRKNREYIILLKDNNGLYHTLTIPNMKQIKKWYATQFNLNLNDPDIITKLKEKQKNFGEIKNIYGLPNPHENLDWLGNQCIEAETEFKYTHWWQSPALAIIGTAFVCMIMFIVTMILSRKL